MAHEPAVGRGAGAAIRFDQGHSIAVVALDRLVPARAVSPHMWVLMNRVATRGSLLVCHSQENIRMAVHLLPLRVCQRTPTREILPP